MTAIAPAKDLVVLTADGQMEFAVKGLLGRGPALGFRELSFDIHVHPAKDPGCYLRGHEFLRSFHRQYCHAIIMFDRDGCGKEKFSREEIENEVEQRLLQSGWEDRGAVIVLDPKIEIWVWSDSPEVDAVLGWTGRTPRLTDWLHSRGYRKPGQTKPDQPKEAMQEALRLARKGRSSAIFHQLAQRVGVNRCTDPAFLKFKNAMQQWFGKTEAAP